MNTGKVIVGVLTGIAAGAVLGMLFVPEKESETQKNLVEKSKDLADALNEKIDIKFDELISAIIREIKKSRLQNDFVAMDQSDPVSGDKLF